MSWHLAPSLVQFRDEVNHHWPKRSKKSDGTIGNAAHQATKSDHNPNKRGSVNAIDITYPGVDPVAVIAAVKKHPSAHYVIFNKKIYTSENNWVAKPYKGASPHTEHLHISIKQSVKAEESTVKWFAAAPKPKPAPKPVPKPVVKPTPAPAPVKPKPAVKPALPKYPGADKLKVGSKNAAVKVVQYAVGNAATGTMTQSDVNKVKAFQRLRPRLWPADGVIGPKTWASLCGGSRVTSRYKV